MAPVMTLPWLQPKPKRLSSSRTPLRGWLPGTCSKCGQPCMHQPGHASVCESCLLQAWAEAEDEEFQRAWGLRGSIREDSWWILWPPRDVFGKF